MKLHIPQEYVEIMKQWVEEHYPHEACGFFAGVERDGVRTVQSLWTVNNISTENLRRRFVIDPLDYLQAERKVERNGMDLLGVFHSHPDHPATPSEYDLRSAQPFFSYVIASVNKGVLGEIRSFRLNEDHFESEQVIIESLKSIS